MIAEVFDRSRVTALRHAVAACAAESGLAGDGLADFVVAVNELLTNAVRHGGGSGLVSLWVADGSVVCEVSDRGGGLGPVSPVRPGPLDLGGRGLWLVRELTDTCEIKTGPEGTAVRISRRTGA